MTSTVEVRICRPLLPISTAMLSLGLDRPEQVIDLVEAGQISHAWDLRSKAARNKREIRVFAPSLSEFAEGRMGLIDKEDREILSAIFSDCEGPTVAASVVAKTFATSPDHVLNLVRAGELTAIRGGTWRRGPKGSPALQLDSVFRFLVRRRL